MGDFKEWLSDNLRYFLVGVVVILIIGGSILGLKIYSSKVNGNSDPAVIRKNTEAQTETGKETETKKQTEKETKKQTEKETRNQTEKATEKQTESSTSSNAGTDSKGSTADNSQNGSNFANNASQNSGGTYSNGSQSSDGTYDNAGNDATTDGNDTQDVTTPQTDAAQPVYMTINSACYMRSYPDYGDNIIGQFEAGTTVEFLGDEGGWYKVSVNGQVGYMGARFFN